MTQPSKESQQMMLMLDGQSTEDALERIDSLFTTLRSDIHADVHNPDLVPSQQYGNLMAILDAVVTSMQYLVQQIRDDTADG
jgi:hypothetical protein